MTGEGQRKGAVELTCTRSGQCVLDARHGYQRIGASHGTQRIPQAESDGSCVVDPRGRLALILTASVLAAIAEAVKLRTVSVVVADNYPPEPWSRLTDRSRALRALPVRYDADKAIADGRVISALTEAQRRRWSV